MESLLFIGQTHNKQIPFCESSCPCKHSCGAILAPPKDYQFRVQLGRASSRSRLLPTECVSRQRKCRQHKEGGVSRNEMHAATRRPAFQERPSAAMLDLTGQQSVMPAPAPTLLGSWSLEDHDPAWNHCWGTAAPAATQQPIRAPPPPLAGVGDREDLWLPTASLRQAHWGIGVCYFAQVNSKGAWKCAYSSPQSVARHFNHCLPQTSRIPWSAQILTGVSF